MAAPDGTLELITGLDSIVMSRFAVVGSYTRFDEAVRQRLKDARARIVAGFASTHQRENHLVWAAPGSGKTYFVEQIAASDQVDYLELNLAKLDEGEFRSGLEHLRSASRPLLCLIDEVDAKPDAPWPYELLLPALDENLNGQGGLVFVLAGSSGSTLDDFKNRIAARPKGVDLLSRVPRTNDCVVAPIDIGDQVLVALSQMLNAAAENGRPLAAVEKLALYYIASSPQLANARQLREFAVRAVGRGSSSDDRVKYDDLFDSGDPENKRFWIDVMPAAEQLVGAFVSIDMASPTVSPSATSSGRRSNLPKPAWPLVGRERELAEIHDLIVGGGPLVTLTGPGGSGKTRLALQSATELSEEFDDGTFFVALAPLRDVAVVKSVVAEVVGLRPDDDLVGWLATKRALLVMDNLEHLPGVAAVVSELLVGDTVVLATARAPLHLSVEHAFSVDPLPDAAAVEFFVSRAAAVGRHLDDDTAVEEICRRLDNLPLALELAAARTRLLSPTALLERLDAALPLLTGGAVDAPERQRTLRATIEWSYDLLDADAQATFRRLCVFRGAFTVEAAEAIAGADLDQLEALVDQSLVRPLSDGRLFQLETLREYAHEQLHLAGEADEYALRHARWYLARLEQIRPVLRARAAEYLAWYGSEADNLRAMLDRLTAVEPMEAARAVDILALFWIARSGLDEGRTRLNTLLETQLPAGSRTVVLHRLAMVERELGHLDAAEAAAVAAGKAAEEAGNPGASAVAMQERAAVAHLRSEPDEAVRLIREALGFAGADEEIRASLMNTLGFCLTEVGRLDEARAVLGEVLEFRRRIGDTVNQAITGVNVAAVDLYAGDFEAARSVAAGSLSAAREAGHQRLVGESCAMLGGALLGLGRPDEARAALNEAIELALSGAGRNWLSVVLGLVAFTADASEVEKAARVRGAVEALRGRNELIQLGIHDQVFEHHHEQLLIDALGPEVWEREYAAGAALTFEQTIELAKSLAREGAVLS